LQLPWRDFSHCPVVILDPRPTVPPTTVPNPAAAPVSARRVELPLLANCGLIPNVKISVIATRPRGVQDETSSSRLVREPNSTTSRSGNLIILKNTQSLPDCHRRRIFRPASGGITSRGFGLCSSNCSIAPANQAQPCALTSSVDQPREETDEGERSKSIRVQIIEPKMNPIIQSTMRTKIGDLVEAPSGIVFQVRRAPA